MTPDPMEHGATPAHQVGGDDNLIEATSENEAAGSPWNTDQVVSWVSPNIKRGKK
ncbi:hypothetical protein [Mycobacteroides abscessus]|uniref:hypothetical protein n=1 Tax=Mycobacteroides abscessus TaxID=36809 RepID=UPI00092CB1CC|nr:hypothetical protein [Mycobacteroides abscessus]SHT40312.1 Uncharacterised protein [Mycobacteroides abscessus subsp. abscessus]SHT53502.1 Uncharacterised protein [Mycobacteroides abscessus subsp. abscessus]SKK64093.1 Uncharacterised protein [Mycobacteroides abscessus subsp. abscessus]